MACRRQFSSITKRRGCTTGDATFELGTILFICYCKCTYCRKTGIFHCIANVIKFFLYKWETLCEQNFTLAVALSLLRYNSSATTTTSKWYIPSAETSTSCVCFQFRSFGNIKQSFITKRLAVTVQLF